MKYNCNSFLLALDPYEENGFIVEFDTENLGLCSDTHFVVIFHRTEIERHNLIIPSYGL